MGFFSKSSDAQPKAEAPAQPEKKNSFIVDGLIAIGFFLFLFFFVVWPLITTWLMCAALWIILWPFMKFVGACNRHTWAGPAYKVLTVGVWSPITVGKFIYHNLKKDDEPHEDKKTAAKPAAAAASTSAKDAATAAPAPQVADKV